MGKNENPKGGITMRALISVTDKTGVVEFARALIGMGWEIYASSGTATLLSQNGIPVVTTETIVGFPQILNGRIKTIHTKIYAGILTDRDNPSHLRDVEEHQIPLFDLVAVNLYAFEKKVAEGALESEIIENIDIGGPAMIRAAAKNFRYVIVVVDPEDYPMVIEKLHSGGLDLHDRLSLALKAFRRTADYDIAIQSFFSREVEKNLPEVFYLRTRKKMDLRYGENPHQKGAFYGENARGLASLSILGGKPLSYNNLLDADSALRFISDFSVHPPAFCVIIKHTNPTGAALRSTPREAFQSAFQADPASAFGGIIAFNSMVDEPTALEITKYFFEIVLAPEFSESALLTFRKKKNLRILQFDLSALSHPAVEIRSVLGGILLQSTDTLKEDPAGWKLVSGEPPTPEEWEDILFAWKICKHVKSNAIVVVKNQALSGVGCGQTSRIASVELALKSAGVNARGAVLASDAFFPFRDNVEMAFQAGVKAIVQPGGSIRDEEVIAAAKEYGLTMLFTGARHFRH